MGSFIGPERLEDKQELIMANLPQLKRMTTIEKYQEVVSQIIALETHSDDVVAYKDLLNAKDAVEAILKAEARESGSMETDFLSVKVSSPAPKLKASYQMVQALATPKEWELISINAMDYEIHGGKLNTLIEQGLVSKKLSKAIETIEPTKAVTIRVK